jgi:hypothetical protein
LSGRQNEFVPFFELTYEVVMVNDAIFISIS